jgi:hypothetical protein
VFSSHHHESCAALLHTWLVASRSEEISWGRCSTSRMAIAVSLPIELIVVVSQNDSTCCACKASRMELCVCICLQILALDTTVARSTNRSVEFVVVTFAVWSVVEHVKLRCWERTTASLTDKALFVVPSRKSTRRILNRLSEDRLRTTAAISLRCWLAIYPAWSYIGLS